MDMEFYGDDAVSSADDFDIDVRLGASEEEPANEIYIPILTRITCSSTCSHTSPKLCC